MLDLSGIVVDRRAKGAPADLAEGVTPRELAAHVGNVLEGRVPMPAAVLRWDLVAANVAAMARYAADVGASLAPHAKTHLAPQLADLQLRAGAWAVTVSDVRQLRLFHGFGLRRALLANQVVDRASVAALWDLLGRDPSLEVLCFVDSVENVAALQRGAEADGGDARLGVLVEVGHEGGRTGCRTDREADAVMAAVEAAPALRLRGVTAFEGLMGGGGVGHQADAAGVEDRIRALLGRVVTVAEDASDRFAPGDVVLTAGGSAWFDVVAAVLGAADLGRDTRVVLRSGGYLVHDRGFYARHQVERAARDPRSADLSSALQVWGAVQSRPEPDLALVTAGRRDLSHDIDLPTAELAFRPGVDAAPRPVDGWDVFSLNDQHAFVRIPPDADVRIGDLVAFGISHPCTTFDKWELLYGIDADHEVVEVVRTYF